MVGFFDFGHDSGYWPSGTALGDATIPASNYIGWVGGPELYRGGDGLLKITKDTNTTGAIIDCGTTADTFRFRNLANNAFANIYGNGVIAAGSVGLGTVYNVNWSTRARLYSPVDNAIRITDNAATISTDIKAVSETLTFAANPGNASKTTSGLIPDGAVLLGVTTRVMTANTNGACTGMDVGDGATQDIFGNNIDINTVTTTSDNSDATANWSVPCLAATEVTLTALGANAFDAVVKVTAHYIQVVAPTA